MQIAYSGGQAFHMQQPTPIQSVGADIRGYGREPVNAAPVNANANQVRPLYRLQVMGIPHYLSLDEFRNQFMKLEGCANACLEKSEMGAILGHYVDFVSQEFAEKCASTFSNWKGWGPKGLAFQRMGHLAAELKRPPGVRLFSSG